MSDPGTRAANLLQKHFPKFGTFRKECTYKEMGNSLYNPGSGESTSVVISTEPVDIIFDEFSFTRTQAAIMQGDESNIMSIDRIAIFPALDLVATPKIDDLIVEGSTTWRVMGMASDPKPAHYELHVRPIYE